MEHETGREHPLTGVTNHRLVAALKSEPTFDALYLVCYLYYLLCAECVKRKLFPQYSHLHPIGAEHANRTVLQGRYAETNGVAAVRRDGGPTFVLVFRNSNTQTQCVAWGVAS